MGEKTSAIGVLLMLALAAWGIGCGEEASTGAGSGGTTSEEREYPWVTGTAREFLIPGGDNLIQTFGEEGTVAEREEASKVVHAWMNARVAEDWVTDCRLLARPYVKDLLWDVRSVTGGKVTTCPGALEYFGDDASGSSGRTLSGPIDSLRVKGPEDTETEWDAWAQWHGPKGIDWVLPLEREAGTWKVDNASPIYRTK